MLLARVEADANTSFVAAHISDLNAANGTDPIVSLPASNRGSDRRCVPVDVPDTVGQK